LRLERDILIRTDAARRLREQQPGNPWTCLDPQIAHHGLGVKMPSSPIVAEEQVDGYLDRWNRNRP
jgi:hypothetical protein